MAKQNIYSAIFDIIPVNKKTGFIDLQKISSLKNEIDLSNFRDPVICDVFDLAFSQDVLPVKTTLTNSTYSKSQLHKDFQAALLDDLPVLNFASNKPEKFRMRGAPIKISYNKIATQDSQELKNTEINPWSKKIAEIGRIDSHSSETKENDYLSSSNFNVSSNNHFYNQSAYELEKKLKGLYTNQKIEATKPSSVITLAATTSPSVTQSEKTEALVSTAKGQSDYQPEIKNIDIKKLQDNLVLACPPEVAKFQWTKLTVVGILANILFLIGMNFFQEGARVRDDVSEKGNAAVESLYKAKDALMGFRFNDAADEFLLAAENFESAQTELNDFGSSMLGLTGVLPGLNKTKDAENLSEAGKLLSESGAEISRAFGHLKNGNIFTAALGSSGNQNSGQDNFESLKNFRLALITADRNLIKAQRLLADVDTSILPEDKEQILIDFQEKIPEFSKFLNSSIDYSGVFMDILGQGGSMKYLVLFQNTTELRPTGGFPGTYALVEFNRGLLKSFVIDDIYNPDGQIKENIVPPKPLQKITPTWGMRDAAWWADFPTSAKKVTEFFKKGSGQTVDGVIAVNIDLPIKFLDFTGPIEMSKYKLTLDASNFLNEVQSEVEYGANRVQPKTILKEFGPVFLEKISNLSKDKWDDVFISLIRGIEQRDIAVYFVDPALERFAKDAGLAGELREFKGDFLMVTNSNIMGSKTDAVISTVIDLDSTIVNNQVERTLNIERKHDGGDSKYGFHNKKNNDYIRVYVPGGSRLVSIEGADSFDLKPLVDYSSSRFRTDADLVELESGQKVENAIEVWEEKGKTVFGFWMIIPPKTTKKVTLKYETEINKLTNQEKEYTLLVQKQPGLKSGFKFSLNVPDAWKLTQAFPEQIEVLNGSLNFNINFEKDILVGAAFK